MKVFALFGRPQVLRSFHGWLVIIWLCLWAAATYFGWVNSVIFVSHLSVVALVLGSFASWQAARVEVKQDEQLDEVDERTQSKPHCTCR